LIEYIKNNIPNSSTITDSSVEDSIQKSIGELLKYSIYKKLNLFNPDKITNNSEILLNNLTSNIYRFLNINPSQISESEIQKINNIIQFYTDISENIASNIYTELSNLLLDMKKISLLINIYDILQKD
jgi:hypothetical protein